MDLEWLGLAWSVTGIHGACRRRAPTLRWGCEVPVLPRSPVSRVCAGQTRPQRAADPGVALIRLLRIRDLLERLLLVLALGMSIAALAAEAIAIGHVMQPARVLAVLAVICSCAPLIELTREVGRS
jgi:hypothetical protein